MKPGGGGGNRSDGGYGGERSHGSRGQPPQYVYRPVDRRSTVVANANDASPGSGPSGTGARGSGGGGGRYHASRGQPPQSVYRRIPVVANADDASPGSGSSGTSARGSGGGGRAGRPSGFRGQSRRNPGVAIPDNASPGSGFSGIGRRNYDIPGANGLTNKSNAMMIPDHSYGLNSATQPVGNVSEAEIQTPESLVSPGHGNDEENQTLPCLSSTPLSNMTHDKKEPYQTVGSGFPDCQIPQESQTGESSSEGTSAKVAPEKSDSQENGLCFDICGGRDTKIPKLKLSLLVKNREMKGRAPGDIEILKTGMILLKGYISFQDQVKLIKACRDLGLGRGGFYQPGYRDGSKLNLKMMCLGKNWDPETCSYMDRRPTDDTKPPPIPDEFQQLVKGVLQRCHHHLEIESKTKNVRDIIPSMSPDICIVNFYTSSGKLGLHQDKDESQESLRSGLPVVSFSLGDTAEFLYGERRDIGEADKVFLNSGDALVFGGKSRHIFHGVSAIKSETAPKSLLQETNLKPGRLNLTFRQY